MFNLTKFNLVLYGIFVETIWRPSYSDIETFDCHMSPYMSDPIIDAIANNDILASHSALSLSLTIHPSSKVALEALVSPPVLFNKAIIGES